MDRFLPNPIDNASIAQRILWNHIVNKLRPLSITEVYYHGSEIWPAATTEFNTYKANIIYLAVEIAFGSSGRNMTALTSTIQFYDEIPALIAYYNNNSTGYTPLHISGGSEFDNPSFFEIRNFYFSYLNSFGYNSLLFKGFKIIH